MWTPPDFDTAGATRCATVFFLHGMGGNESADSAGFSGLLARGVRDGSRPPVLAVFPNGGRSGCRDAVKRRIVAALVPWVDRTCPPRANPAARIVAGLAIGGAGAVRLTIRHPNLFGAAASWGEDFSPQRQAELASMQEHAPRWHEREIRVRLVNGDRDRPAAFAPLEARLAAPELPYKAAVWPNTTHHLSRYDGLDGAELWRFPSAALQLPQP